MGVDKNRIQAWITKLEKNNVHLPFSEQLEMLFQPVTVAGRRLSNRIVIQPMEGCDGTATGAPGESTLRRYHRFAAGGAAFIWFEAVAICQEGRANPRQLWLHEKTADSFQRLLEGIRETAVRAGLPVPLLVMQATHSGRYAKPQGVPEPLIAYHNPLFEKNGAISDDRILSDAVLQRLEEQMGETAALAEKVGFDGVDIKSCHRYLASELLSAYTRPGAYGGTLENRTRFLRNSLRNARQATSNSFVVTSRLNVYDGFPWPFGFGVSENGGVEPDLSEPLWLVNRLKQECGIQMLNITIGNPYVNPHVNRPANRYPTPCQESPLQGVERMLTCVSVIQKAVPDVAVVASGLSYPGPMAPYVAAGGIQQGCFTLAGFGRMAFAYPDFVTELKTNGQLDPKKCCIACGKCSELMRAGSIAGCVIQDSAYYLPYYRQAVLGERT